APKEAGTIVILATGDTIAGTDEEGKATGYDSSTLAADQLVSAVPELKDVAPIETMQIQNVNSDDISSETWLQLAKTINELAGNPNVAGFVITHDTDTLEETAYFLNLTVKTDKPVVITGSMRPATSLSADGAMNLYESVCVAASQKAAGKGVLAVFSDRIYTGRSVTKTSTYRVEAIAAGEAGAIGIVRDGEVFIYEEPTIRHTGTSEFDVSNITTLPKVSIVYFSVDADPELLTYAAEHSDGLVIAGAGAGEFSEGFAKVIEGLNKPVVISSRIDDGIITQNAVICKNTVAANNLPPQKAAILLRLALASGNASNEKLIELYKTY
ncbi:MAG: asparaginase, partial [Coriobacteriales bacterium]|nr:asparaginase [Coriobacteriales bacterium]